jgi:methyl-accepting chemotaxis protein
MHTEQTTALQAAVQRLTAFLNGSWNLTEDLNLDTGDPLAAELDAGWRRFRKALLASLLQQETITAQSAAAAARNSVRTKDMQTRMAEMQASMKESVENLAQMTQSAVETAAAVESSTATVHQAREATESTASNAAAMATALTDVARFLTTVSQQLDTLAAQSQQIGDLSGVVKKIATQTNMLSLNASIEAARAGAHGRGFGVVAAEVRRLADSTAKQATQIEQVVREVAGQLQKASSSMATGLQQAQSTAEQAQAASRSVSNIGQLVVQVAAPFQQLAATMQQYSASLSAVSSEVSVTNQHIVGLAEHVNLVAGESQSLLKLTQNAQISLARFRKGSFTDAVKEAALRMATDLAQVFDAAISAGKVTLDDVLALEYTEITGAAIRDLQRLFHTARVPASGFKPPKYSTRYDRAVDVALRQVLDRYLGVLPGILFTSVMDLNGYLPISTTETCKEWTGDFQADLLGNRLKRFSTDQAQLEAAHMGLRLPALPLDTSEPYVRNMKSVLSRAEIIRYGNSLKQAEEPADLFTIYTFASLSGRVTTQLAVPVYVRGHRYGAAIIGWEPKVDRA